MTTLLKTLVHNEQADLVIHGYQAIVGDFSRTVLRESLLNKNGTYFTFLEFSDGRKCLKAKGGG